MSAARESIEACSNRVPYELEVAFASKALPGGDTLDQSWLLFSPPFPQIRFSLKSSSTQRIG